MTVNLKKIRRIGIIDSGVNRQFVRDYNIKVVSAASFDIDKTGFKVRMHKYNEKDIANWKAGLTDNLSDKNGHGTAVLSIIWKRYPDARFSIAKIDDSLENNYSLCLLESMRWMVRQVRPDAVNISLGTSDYRVEDELYKLTLTAKEEEIKVYAAGSNYISFSAAFGSVITVLDLDTINKDCHWIMQAAADKIINDNSIEIWQDSRWIKNKPCSSWTSAMAIGM